MSNPSQRKQRRPGSRTGTDKASKATTVGKPATPGNRLAVKHAAHAQPPAELVNEQVQRIYDVLAESAPLRDGNGDLPAADATAVLMLARTLVRLHSVGQWLDAHGPVDRRGKPRSALRAESKLSNQAMAYMRELGLTPRSRAQIGASLVAAVDVAAALSEPDAERRKAMLRQAGIDGGAGA
jgi:hypothetical protein